VKVQPYLCFEGRCEEALAFYREALGAEVIHQMRFSDGPPPDGTNAAEGCAGPLPAGIENKILHSAFRIGETVLMASDGMSSGNPRFEGISVALTADGGAEAERLFAALAQGGEVTAPMVKTFFSSHFGMVKDRFGVHWMVTV